MGDPTRPKTVILVDLNGQRGECCHCGQPATIAKRHTCGAEVTGLAINTAYAPNPTFEQGIHVNAMLRGLGIAFYGAGHKLKAPTGYRFVWTKRPGELA